MVSNIFYFHPYLEKIPILTNIFQMGWNHQLDLLDSPVFFCCWSKDPVNFGRKQQRRSEISAPTTFNPKKSDHFPTRGTPGNRRYDFLQKWINPHQSSPRWWFQVFHIFIPTCWNDPSGRAYFSDGRFNNHLATSRCKDWLLIFWWLMDEIIIYSFFILEGTRAGTWNFSRSTTKGCWVR